MDTLADVVAAGRDREGTAVAAPERTADYGHREFSTNVWKAGNLLRHYGARPGARVAVVVGPKEPAPGDEPGTLGAAADPLVAVLGGAVAGSVVDLTPAEPVDARALVLPDAWTDRYDPAPGCSAVAYGGPPEAPDVAHFERELWSENPVEPPAEIEASDPAIRVEGTDYTHGELVEAGGALADEWALEPGDSVAVSASLSNAGALAAGVVASGVVAPLSAGATVLLWDDDDAPPDAAVYVVGGTADDDRAVDPETVL